MRTRHIQSNMQTSAPSDVLIPTVTPMRTVSTTPQAFSKTVNWQEYNNPEGHYVLKFPEGWLISDWGPRSDLSEAVSSIKLSNPTTHGSATETFSIIVVDNQHNLSLLDFLNKYVVATRTLSSFEFTPILIDGMEGMETSRLPGQFERQDVFVVRDKKIYWFSSEPSIPGNLFSSLISTVKFIDK